MTVTLNFALWTLLTLGSTASAALVAAARTVDNPGGHASLWLPLGVASATLLVVILGVDARTLFNWSPYAMYLLQSCLPLVALTVTGYLACRWYLYQPGHLSAAGLPAGFAAILVAAGAAILFVMPETATGLALAALVTLALGGVASRLPPAAIRAAGLTAATASAWAAAFLLYLTVFPEQIAVGMEQSTDGTGSSLPVAELTALAALGAAFVLGFLKIRRG